jgi:hypothetical protein
VGQVLPGINFMEVGAQGNGERMRWLANAGTLTTIFAWCLMLFIQKLSRIIRRLGSASSEAFVHAIC